MPCDSFQKLSLERHIESRGDSCDTTQLSVNGVLSALTSISSHASVKTSSQRLLSLVKSENMLIKKFSAHPLGFENGTEAITANLIAVMNAMLTCVEECGGESRKRYIRDHCMW